MNSKNIIAVLSVLTLMAAGSAYAGDEGTHSHINKQNLSKRAYQHELDESAYNKKDNFEGATLIDEKDVEADIMRKHKRLDMLGRRHYIE